MSSRRAGTTAACERTRAQSATGQKQRRKLRARAVTRPVGAEEVGVDALERLHEMRVDELAASWTQLESVQDGCDSLGGGADGSADKLESARRALVEASEKLASLRMELRRAKMLSSALDTKGVDGDEAVHVEGDVNPIRDLEIIAEEVSVQRQYTD